MSEAPADSGSATEPTHLNSNCERCGSALVLYGTLSKSQVEQSAELSMANYQPDATYDDEWVCPSCLDGIRLDMPT